MPFQNDFKLFTSPQDYGEKVIAKITEFNATVGQVNVYLKLVHRVAIDSVSIICFSYCS